MGAPQQYDWDAIAAEVFRGLRAGRSAAAVVREHPEWPGYHKILQHLMHDYYDEYQIAKRDGAEALGDQINDMLETLRHGNAEFRSAKVFLEAAMRRMGQMNAQYNDRKVHHEHTYKMDDVLRKRLEEAEARVRLMQEPTFELESRPAPEEEAD